MAGYIYLLHLQFHLVNGENTFKIGRTKSVATRIKQYPRNAHILCTIFVPDMIQAEYEIIAIFHKHFEHRKDIGAEFFRGDVAKMIRIIGSYLNIMNVSYATIATASQENIDDQMRETLQKGDNDFVDEELKRLTFQIGILKTI